MKSVSRKKLPLLKLKNLERMKKPQKPKDSSLSKKQLRMPPSEGI